MKFFVATLATETNTFSPIPTALQDFKVCRAGEKRYDFCTTQALFDHLQEQNIEVVEDSNIFAEPQGITTRIAYGTLLSEQSLKH